MDERRIVVVVEEVEVARTALQWALHNLLRYGDTITLLHVFPANNSGGRSSKSKLKKNRLLRLKGFQLALSFQDICNTYSNTKVEIVVTEGDQEGRKISAMVRQIGASVLVVGLHDHSFLYKKIDEMRCGAATSWEVSARNGQPSDGFRLAMANKDVASSLNCRVLAIKQPPSSPSAAAAAAAAGTKTKTRTTTTSATALALDCSTNLDFSHIELAGLQLPELPTPKIPYRICPSPSAIIWRSRKSRRK